MAKYVLLAFDDDASADEFVEGLRETRLVTHEDGNTPMVRYSADVRGVYKKPTKFCDCKDIKKRGFTRGRKYGWWVCSQCGKPTIGWGRGDHWFLALGKNLLPVDNRAPEYRGDGVFARSFKPCGVCGNTLVTELGHAQAKVYCDFCQEWR